MIHIEATQDLIKQCNEKRFHSQSLQKQFNDLNNKCNNLFSNFISVKKQWTTLYKINEKENVCCRNNPKKIKPELKQLTKDIDNQNN